MLEFYFKYYPNKFLDKASKLAAEIQIIFKAEDIRIENTTEENIDFSYRELIGEELFGRLNNLYYTIRRKARRHRLLCKYLPELKEPPKGELLFADFFSGAGGLSQGLINSGFNPGFVNDIYLDALETYYFNHQLALEYFFSGDIRDFANNIEHKKHLFKNVKIIAGGPPCQGFSTANRQNFTRALGSSDKRFIEDERNVLYKHFVKILGAIRPDFFIIENVRGMMKVERQIMEDITQVTDGFYTYLPLILDAQQFDIPQSRRRYFLIGCNHFMYIEKMKENLERSKLLTSRFKLRDALFGLPEIKTNPHKLWPEFEGEENGFTILKKNVASNDFVRKINDNLENNYILNHKSRYNNDNDLKIFALLPEGENSLHESVREHVKYTSRNHIFKDKYFKLRGSEVSKTITSHMKFDCHMYIHPQQVRGLSPREAARIQTFPDAYFFRGTLNSWYKQIGNAVPVKLAQVIGSQIINYYK